MKILKKTPKFSNERGNWSNKAALFWCLCLQRPHRSGGGLNPTPCGRKNRWMCPTPALPCVYSSTSIPDFPGPSWPILMQDVGNPGTWANTVLSSDKWPRFKVNFINDPAQVGQSCLYVHFNTMHPLRHLDWTASIPHLNVIPGEDLERTQEKKKEKKRLNKLNQGKSKRVLFVAPELWELGRLKSLLGWIIAIIKHLLKGPVTAGMKLFHCPRIITRARSLWRAEERREGRVGEINGMQITLSARRESRDMRGARLVGQTELIHQAEVAAEHPEMEGNWEAPSVQAGFHHELPQSPTSPRPLSARINQPSNYTSPNCSGMMQFQSDPCVTQGWLPTSKASAPPSLPFWKRQVLQKLGLFHNLALMQSATYEYLTLLGTSINHLVLGMSGQNFNLFYS